MKNEIVLFADGDINLEVELSPELETVWLTQKQMGELFERRISNPPLQVCRALSGR